LTEEKVKLQQKMQRELHETKTTLRKDVDQMSKQLQDERERTQVFKALYQKSDGLLKTISPARDNKPEMEPSQDQTIFEGKSHPKKQSVTFEPQYSAPPEAQEEKEPSIMQPVEEQLNPSNYFSPSFTPPVPPNFALFNTKFKICNENKSTMKLKANLVTPQAQKPSIRHHIPITSNKSKFRTVYKKRRSLPADTSVSFVKLDCYFESFPKYKSSQ